MRGMLTFLAAWILGAGAGYPLLFLGLIPSGTIATPLALGVAGLVAALGAVWVGNLLALNHTRALLLPCALLPAAVGVVLGVLWPRVPGAGPGEMAGYAAFAAASALIALSAFLSAGSLRARARGGAGRDALASLGLLALGALVVAAILARYGGLGV